MRDGLKTTFDVLSRTENEAAVAVLLPALDAPQRAVQEGALHAILRRHSLVGQREIIRRLHRIDEGFKAILDEHRGRLTHALRDAVLDHDDQMCRNGCQAIVSFRDYDLIPTLINAAEDESNVHSDLAAATLLELSDLLYEELSGGRDYKPRRDPQLVRRNVLPSLEESVRRFPKHKRRDLIEAFLQLAGRDNSVLMQILGDPRHSSYLPVIHALTNSTRLSIMRLILGHLDDTHAPSALVSVMVHRLDRRFIDNLLRKIGREPSAAARANLKHVKSVAWLRQGTELLDDLDDAGQHSALQLVLASGMKPADVQPIVQHLARHGKPGGRRAAVEALANLSGSEANQLVVQCLQDSDPLVQAAALSQLRNRGIPNALATLIASLNSPHDVVRRAAQQCLVEFSFSRYLSAFDSLDEEVRRTTGALVCRADPQAVAQLTQELRSGQGKRRLRGLAMARFMQAVNLVEKSIRGMLDDPDHLVRTEAAHTLAACDSPEAHAALEQALGDTSRAVQEAAQSALVAMLARQQASASAGILSSPREVGHESARSLA